MFVTGGHSLLNTLSCKGTFLTTNSAKTFLLSLNKLHLGIQPNYRGTCLKGKSTDTAIQILTGGFLHFTDEKGLDGISFVFPEKGKLRNQFIRCPCTSIQSPQEVINRYKTTVVRDLE
eukprot:TRINITY_DN4236_c0_g1_i1.p1 TRINITY_DN4236_c0_g1~~TRINITY_DN4236_c0_g1_i1.p1  ORF type:complete len:118 (+),score=20.94 TRINITY_DN4236_c0_g1_i1:739-1092(+)